MTFRRNINKKLPSGTLGILALVVIVTSVVIGSFVATKGQRVEKSEAAAQTSLSLSPSTQNLTPGQNFTVNVKMNTGTNRVIGYDINLNFDSSALQINSIQKGSGVTAIDQEVKNVFDNTAGTISYSAFTLNLANGVQGTNVDTLVISGTVKSSASQGTKNISFNTTTTKVSDAVDPANVLQNTTGASVTVSSSTTSTPTPNTTATSTPRPSSTATPQPTNSNAQATTTLALNAIKTSIAVNQNLPVNVTINTNTNDVIGADIDITFDKTRMQALDIQAGSFFSSPDVSNKIIDNTNGHAKITVNIPPSGSAKRGTGTIAIVTFKSLTEGVTRVDFGNANIIAALNMNGLNALNSVTGLGLTVVPGLLGDINRDGTVDIVDYTILFGNFGKNATDAGADARADINNDGKINILDYTYVFENFGKTI